MINFPTVLTISRFIFAIFVSVLLFFNSNLAVIIALILFIAVLVMGADKIPEFARSLGKGINEIKHATNEIKGEIKKSSSELENKSSNITKEIKKAKEDLDSISSSIKRDL